MHTKQHGISMVELLIAMAISSFLILGVTQMYIDNKRNYLYQQNQSANVENSRYSLKLLERDLLKAGYRPAPQDSRELAYPAATVSGCGNFSAGQIIKPSVGNAGVCIRYLPDEPNELDCHGNTITSTAPVTIRFERDNSKQLNCYVNGGAAATLLTNVNNLTFWYGVDKSTNRNAEQYLTAAQAATTTQPIVAVRFASLIESPSDKVALSQDQYHFPLSATTATTATDQKLYKSSQGTATLRNIAQ